MSRESDLSPSEAAYALKLEVTGDGRGEVRIVPPDVICRSDCSEIFSSPVSVTLTVTVEEGSAIRGWGGACSSAGTTRQCLLRVENAVTASLQLTGAPQPDDEDGGSGPDQDQGGGEEDEVPDDGAHDDDDDDDDGRDEVERDKKGKGGNGTDPRGGKDDDQRTGGKNENKEGRGDNDAQNNGENNGKNNDYNEPETDNDEGDADEEGNELLPGEPVDVELTLASREGS